MFKTPHVITKAYIKKRPGITTRPIGGSLFIYPIIETKEDKGEEASFVSPVKQIVQHLYIGLTDISYIQNPGLWHFPTYQQAVQKIVVLYLRDL